MKIFIRVKPNARKEEVVKLEANRYVVSVPAPPIEGRANEKLLEILADYFSLPKQRVRIVSGHKARTKVVEIS